MDRSTTPCVVVCVENPSFYSLIWSFLRAWSRVSPARFACLNPYVKVVRQYFWRNGPRSCHDGASLACDSASSVIVLEFCEHATKAIQQSQYPEKPQRGGSGRHYLDWFHFFFSKIDLTQNEDREGDNRQRELPRRREKCGSATGNRSCDSLNFAHKNEEFLLLSHLQLTADRESPIF